MADPTILRPVSRTTLSKVELPDARKRRLASLLLQNYPLRVQSADIEDPQKSIRVVCVADTHNAKPELPPGEVLIHAGDLSEIGSFDEIQAQLDWISSQQHPHKIVVAGNHDLLLDEDFLEKYPERRYGQPQTLKDLDWGHIHYLNENSITIDVYSNSTSEGNGDGNEIIRPITIYGSPITPQYGVSAFQVPSHVDVWTNRLDPATDIVVCHGPPHLHLDLQGVHRAGCPYFAHEIARTRPRLVVFGHIHVAYGREDVVFGQVMLAHDDIVRSWAGWGGIFRMTLGIAVARLRCLFLGRNVVVQRERLTTMVNAAAGGQKNPPVVIKI